jgi:hypothetical protein
LLIDNSIDYGSPSTKFIVWCPFSRAAPNPQLIRPLRGRGEAVLLRSVTSCLKITLLTIIVLATITTTATSQSWNALGVGLDGPVYCLAVYKNQLYAGGAFTTAGGTPAANIARWNGVDWSPLGSGTNKAVYALFVQAGHLYVGGSFTSCGGVACSYVARWDSANWTPVGSGLNGPVFSIAEYQRTLFIGGDFSKVGANSVNRIAAWDGNNWRDVSGGVDNTVYALKVTGLNELFADLYVGGAFIQPGLSRLAWYHPAYQAWRATEWGGFNAPVFAFANQSVGLVVGGSFSSTGLGYSVNHLAQNGYDFHGGADGEVYALLSEGNNLHVGGFFNRVGPSPGLYAPNIATWSGSSWEALGPGTNDSVRTMVMFQGQLYAGGEFDSAGGTEVNHVARWGAATDVMSLPAAIPVSITLLQNYPNPFNPSTTIKYELPKSSDVRLSVYDLLGREVTVLVNERRDAGVHEVKYDAAGLSSGMYLYRLQAGDFVQTRKLILSR